MPLYEYRCGECREVSEFRMKISDPHPTDCPACGQQSLRKIISNTAFQLKGGGWYNEGYDGRSNQKPKTDTPKSSDTSSQANSETSTATKPEKKPEKKAAAT